MTMNRPAAVAGVFYPGEPDVLRSLVAEMLGEARARTAAAVVPKALIAPHAGYIYSGPVAASAYQTVESAAARIRRVVLVGPSHRVPLMGVAVPSAAAFDGPLGTVPLDRVAIDGLLADGLVTVSDEAHAREHSLEVQIPFLQCALGEVSLVPLVVGRAAPEMVSGVLDRVWGGEETLVVISSDLSHYETYDDARAMDGRTCQAVEACTENAIGPKQACGAAAINGLLALARARGLLVSTLDVRSSGDTAGDRSRVVGYGAWSVGRLDAGDDPSADLAELLARHQQVLLDTAARSIDAGLRSSEHIAVNSDDYPPALRRRIAAFVSLTIAGHLRGCVGSAEARRSLIADVAANAFAAAFRDSRFAPLTPDERDGAAITVSLLGPKRPIDFTGEDDLVARLRPGRDGLVIDSGGRRALFLPQVWANVQDPRRFLALLKDKAGIGADEQPADLAAWRFVGACSSAASLKASGPLWV